MPDLAFGLRLLLALAVVVAWFALTVDRRRRGWWALVLALAAGVGAWRLTRPPTPTSSYVAARPLAAYQRLTSEDVALATGRVSPGLIVTPTLSITAAADAFNPTGHLLLTDVAVGAPILPTQVLSVPHALQPRYIVNLTLETDAVPGSGVGPGAQVDIYAAGRRFTADESFSLPAPDSATLLPIMQALVLASTLDATATTTTLTLGLREAATVERLLTAAPYVTFQLALHAPPATSSP